MSLNFYKSYKTVGKVEWEKKVANLKVIAETFAQQLHILTQVERVSDLETYYNEVHGVLDPLSSADHLFVLENTQKFFIERYGEEIRRSGTSTDIRDQVTHRVGKENKNIIFELFAGFNVHKLTAENYHRIYNDDYNLFVETLKKTLLPNQLEEYEEYRQRYPKILIAKALINNLGLLNDSQINMQATKLLLRTRDSNEIQEILIEAEILLKKVPYESLDIRRELKSKLSSVEEEQLNHYLEGVNIPSLAESILNLFRNPESTIEELNEVPSIHADLKGLFLKAASKQSGLKIELELYPKISKILFVYSEDIRKAVIRFLEEQFGLALTEELYELNHHFSPMRVATTIKKLADSAPPRAYHTRDESYLSEEDIKEIKDLYRKGVSNNLEVLASLKAKQVKQEMSSKIIERIISPLLILDDSEIYQVTKAFLILTGNNLADYLYTKESFISRNDSSPQAREVINVVISGLATFNFHEKQVITPAVFDDKIKDIANIIFQKDSIALNDRGEKLTAVISGLPYNQLLHLMEYYQKSFNLPLLDNLESDLSIKLLIEIKTQILGLNYQSIVEDLKNPRYLCELNRIHPNEAILVNAIAKDILDSYAQIKDLPLVQIFLHLLVSRIKVARIRRYLTSKGTLSDEDSINLLGLFVNETSSSYLKFSYNHWYTDRTLSFEFNNGTLVQSLKLAANNNVISRPLFVRIILVLEGLSTELIENIHMILTHLDINNIKEFQAILVEYKEHLPLIKRLYNVLDQGNTLRDRIYDSSLDLTSKNKLLLILDGYNPDLVAEEIQSMLSAYSEKELGEKVVRILTTQTEDPNNLRIPKSKNWTSEMYHQIRLSFKNLFGSDLLIELKKKNVPIVGLGINWIAYRLYGEVSKNVLEFEKRLKVSDSDTMLNAAVADLLEPLVPLLRERFVNMYASYFGVDFLEQIKNKTDNPVAINDIRVLITPEESPVEDKRNLSALLDLLDKDLKI